MSYPEFQHPQSHNGYADAISALTAFHKAVTQASTFPALVSCFASHLPHLLKVTQIKLGIVDNREKQITLYSLNDVKERIRQASLTCFERLKTGDVCQQDDILYWPLLTQDGWLVGFLHIEKVNNDKNTHALLENVASILSTRLDALKTIHNFAWDTVDALSAHVAVLDENGEIIAVNRAWRDFASQNGSDPSVVSEGINYLAVCDAAARLGDEDARMFAHGIRKVLYEGEDEFAYEYPCHSPEENRWFTARTTRISEKNPARVVIAHENVTRVKLAEQLERHQRALAEALLDITTALNSTLQLEEVLSRILTHLVRVVPHDDANITLVESEMVRVVRFYEDTTTEHTYHEDKLATHLQQIIDTQQALILTSDVLNGFRSYLGAPILVDGQVIGVISLYATQDQSFNQEQVGRLQVFANHAAVAIQNARLYEQAQQLAAIEERQRLANDLHDSVSQTLFSADLIAQSLPHLWQINPERASSITGELHELTSGAQAEMRNLLLELRPAAINTVEIFDLLRQLANAFNGRTRIPVNLSVDKFTELPIDVKKAVYRIAQESLNNVARHAFAEHVVVTLQRTDVTTLSLVIEDDGQGFDSANYTAQHGLEIMRERAENTAGVFILKTEIGSGTRIQVEWQLADANFGKQA